MSPTDCDTTQEIVRAPVDSRHDGRSHVQLEPTHSQAELRVENRAKGERGGQPRGSKVSPFRGFPGAAWSRVEIAARDGAQGEFGLAGEGKMRAVVCAWLGQCKRATKSRGWLDITAPQSILGWVEKKRTIKRGDRTPSVTPPCPENRRRSGCAGPRIGSSSRRCS